MQVPLNANNETGNISTRLAAFAGYSGVWRVVWSRYVKLMDLMEPTGWPERS